MFEYIERIMKPKNFEKILANKDVKIIFDTTHDVLLVEGEKVQIGFNSHAELETAIKQFIEEAKARRYVIIEEDVINNKTTYKHFTIRKTRARD